jgi:hypothetical protein
MQNITNLEEISAIKITCGHCKTELTLPAGRNHLPETCIGCGQWFPYNRILDFLRQFSQLKKQSEDNNCVKISFVSDGEPQC